MFKIVKDVFKVTRATKGTFEFSLDDYVFKPDDTIEFRLYEKGKLDKKPVKSKEIKISEESTSVDIELTCDDTNIGIPCNEMVEYWYEIELNDDQTVMGFDEKGPKRFELYPKGVEEDDQE